MTTLINQKKTPMIVQILVKHQLTLQNNNSDQTHTSVTNLVQKTHGHQQLPSTEQAKHQERTNTGGIYVNQMVAHYR